MTRILLVLSALSLTSSALAADAPADGPLATEQYIAEVNDRWGGVGIGMDIGLWGDRFGQGFKVDVPFGSGTAGQHFGARGRVLLVHDDFGGQFAPVAAGGVELFGRGPVMLGIVRVYGAGGFYYGTTLNRVDATPALAGGGHFGVEFAASKRHSFTFEVGGQGPMHPDEIDAGASVMAGTTVYLGRVGGKK